MLLQVEFVSSDYSNCPGDNKLTASIFDARAGITGLETLVASFYTDQNGRVAAPERVAASYLAEKPARFFSLWPRKGTLTVAPTPTSCCCVQEARIAASFERGTMT